MPEPTEEPRIASKQSIKKAYILLRSIKGKERKVKRPGQPPKEVRKSKKTVGDYRAERHLKTLAPVYPPTKRRHPWQMGFVMQEFRNAMGKQDWIALQRLFPYCGPDSCDFQALRFTYGFLLSLCSPISNESYFQNFLETCIGGNVETTLQRLMTLQTMHRRGKRNPEDDEDQD
ncbi:uncharacterized protein [Fopius arisanus]|uniref:Uncharacterized protein n=1 Tax=Fopius arisanus TaxID=64838 RepID=A0A9R1TJK2_9HYME|nr:PREDICTED: uncharacterized protein LOC105270842 [Fopius arisanus]